MPEEQVSPLAQIWTRSLDDADFRARLLADPRSTLEDEMGLMLPENMQVNVVENTRHEYTIVLPVAADASGDEDAQRRGTTQLMYHIPEHSFASDLHLEQVQGRPGASGFGANPHPPTTRGSQPADPDAG